MEGGGIKNDPAQYTRASQRSIFVSFITGSFCTMVRIKRQNLAADV